jgi:AraC-like DNA-binding protein
MRIRISGPLALQKSGAGGIHPFHEILYIEQGESELQWMGRQYQLSSPVLIAIPANTPHWLTPSPQGVTGWFIEVDMQQEAFLDIELAQQWNQQQVQSGETSWSDLMSAQIACVSTVIDKYSQHILEPAATKKLLELDIRKILLLIQIAVQDSEASAPPNNDEHLLTIDRHIFTVLRHMERSYTQPITLEDLSLMCNFTPSYIIRLFKETIGSTPIQYLQKLRLNAAVCYLEATSLPVQEIAHIAGFSDLHYFSRIFKQKMGESPSTWRKRWLNSQHPK